MTTHADVCVIACAEAFRGDGEMVASPFGVIPRLGALLARETFEPDLVITDGESRVVRADGSLEGWLPFRHFFDLVQSGRRHAMMGASQLDQHGNQNISCIGDWQRPKTQLIGSRGGPGNTVNHPVSYWVPNHTPRVFVEAVDFISGVGTGLIRYAVTNLCVLRLVRGRWLLASLHPGVELDDVRAQTGFELVVPDPLAATREPSGDELSIIERLDPSGNRFREVP